MALGALSIASALFILLVNPYDFIFKLKVIFTPGGETYELWRKPPVDLYLRVWLFNVTNREAFMAGEEKLRVQEAGPYVYRELLEHTNVTFNNNGTMTTIPRHPLVWVPEMSNGTEEDILVLPNIALLSYSRSSGRIKDSSLGGGWGLNLLAQQTNEQPLVAMTAKEFMFGYESPLVKLGNKFLPSWINFDKLGLIDRMYNFEGDVATFFTGEKEVKQAGLIEKYRGFDYLPHWEGKHCQKLTGASDATKFPSLIDKNDTLYFYRKSVCRTMAAIFTGEVKNVQGLDAYRYKFPPNALDNGEIDPENKCFCRKGACLPKGLIDVHECYYGFPIAVSYPHFYEADQSLVDAVEGSNPDKERHESYFYIEPKSGLPLDVSFRFQINMYLGDISGVTRAARFKNMALPMLWTEIMMKNLPDDLNNRFILYLNILPVVEKVIMYAFFVAGVFFLLGSMSRVLFLNWDMQKKSADMDFSRGNTQELKRIHLDKIKNCESKPVTEKSKEVEAYYSSLLTTHIEEAVEEGSERERTLKSDVESNNTNTSLYEGLDNISCGSNDSAETFPPQYDLVTFLSLKEDIV
ncbi:hypothetical protein L9F63_017337 [Diploptera punctata]|uniref:Scavenger receptor class B member 1 n=1 Tax=Diploptera punctata TaxID=6984 RepID=A0AAD7ZZE2_DIPPU|nr:hypothetical protein L9F63_017337 [Diploptera punctata]